MDMRSFLNPEATHRTPHLHQAEMLAIFSAGRNHVFAVERLAFAYFSGPASHFVKRGSRTGDLRRNECRHIHSIAAKLP
jgi:hypothetical protein